MKKVTPSFDILEFKEYFNTHKEMILYILIAVVLVVDLMVIPFGYMGSVQETYTIYAGDTMTLKTDIAAPVYKMQRNSIASITDKGLITALKRGSSRIKVSGKEDSKIYKVKVVKDPIDKKSIVVVGDSLSTGHKLGQEKSWVTLLAEENYMTYDNLSRGGIALSVNDRHTKLPVSMNVDRLFTTISAPDYVIVNAGANDWNSHVKLGANDSRDVSTYKGAINTIIDKIQKKSPKSTIIFMTPYKRRTGKNHANLSYEDYANAMIEVCKAREVACFDNYHNSGMDFTDEKIAKTIDEGLTLGLEANRHFSAIANKKLAELYKQVLRENT